MGSPKLHCYKPVKGGLVARLSAGMRGRYDQSRTPIRIAAHIRIAAALTAAAGLLGCAGTGSYFPSLGGLPNWFTSTKAPETTDTVAAAPPPGISLENDCPAITIRTGAATLAVAAKGQLPTANDLRYQLTFTEL